MIGRKYKSLEQIGQGSFGVVYRGQNTKTGELVAIKTELNGGCGLLKHETTILNYLYKSGCRNVPIVYWFGGHADSMTLVVPLYQCSLTDIFAAMDQHSTNMIINEKRAKNMGKIDEIMESLISGLNAIHRTGIIHRDIKPDNIMFSNGAFVFIDFGFATSYKTDNGRHIEYIEGKSELIGSPKYASIDIHMGIEPSRRDDMISLGYVYLYMLFGALDWTSTTAVIGTRSNSLMNPHLLRIASAKSWDSVAELTKSHENIYRYLDICYQLEFDENPDDYDYRFFNDNL